MTSRPARCLALSLTAGALLAGCRSTTTDVSTVAGVPTTATSAQAGQPGQAPARAGEVASAPVCRGFPVTGDGLPCLGPGQPVDLGTLPGPTIVSVWASWCEPCRRELPVLQAYADTGGSVLGVAVASDPDAAAALLADLGIRFPSVQDPASGTRVRLGWVGPPANVIIVRGEVVYRFTDPITSTGQLERAMQQVGG